MIGKLRRRLGLSRAQGRAFNITMGLAAVGLAGYHFVKWVQQSAYRDPNDVSDVFPKYPTFVLIEKKG